MTENKYSELQREPLTGSHERPGEKAAGQRGKASLLQPKRKRFVTDAYYFLAMAKGSLWENKGWALRASPRSAICPPGCWLCLCFVWLNCTQPGLSQQFHCPVHTKAHGDEDAAAETTEHPLWGSGRTTWVSSFPAACLAVSSLCPLAVGGPFSLLLAAGSQTPARQAK